MADVKFRFTADDTEVRRKLNSLKKLRESISRDMSDGIDKSVSKSLIESIKEATREANKLGKALNQGPPSNNDLINSLLEKKKAIEDERLAQAKLRTESLEASKVQRASKQREIDDIRAARKERQKEISDLNTLRQIEQEAKAMLAEKRAANEDLNRIQKEQNLEYQKSRKDLADYTLIQKKAAEERRKANEEERKATKVLKDAEKARKDAEREEAKRLKAVEKRKKELEKESSEYYKLNKALGAVRKETKDLLAEMFRMERQGHKNTLGYQKLKEKADALTKQTLYLDQGIKKIDYSLGLHQRNVGNYTEALEVISPVVSSINQKLALFGTSLDELASKPGAIKELGASFMTMGKNIVGFLLSPIGLVVTTIAGLFMLFQRNKQTVIDFNSGLLNVSKTTGLTGSALKGLSDDIIQLSRSLQTVSTDKLLQYATVAGQLGVKGSKNILAFTEALAKLETASDITGEEGGSEIARLLTLVDGGVMNVKQFGDEIVNLGNNFAATEKEILSNAEAISQNVGLYRIGRQDVLAYATATKSLGIEAEVVGSTFQKTLGSFEKSIRSGKGVDEILKVVGGTREELARRFREDASGVFQLYIKGLNDIHKAGGSVNAQMEKNGIADIRQRRVIGTLAAGYDTLSKAMDTVKDAAGALNEEFETASGKLVNQTNRIGIAWDNLVLTIENGEGAIGKASVAIIESFANILEAITNVSNSKSLTEFFTRFGSFTGDRFAKDLSNTLGDISKEGTVDRNRNDLVPYRDMKEFYRAARSEQEKMLKAQEEAYQLRLKEYNLDKSHKNVQELNYQAEKRAKMLASLSVAENKQSTSANNAEIDESESERKKREAAEAKAKRQAEQAAERQRQAFERQRALQLSIDQVNEAVSRNQLSRDQQEIESVRDKYRKIREEVRKFNADPKNKGQRVNTSGLNQSERFEVGEVTTRIGTSDLVSSLSEQKAIYDEYYSYLENTSKDEADKRYKNELSLINGYRSRLNAELLEIASVHEFAGLNGGGTAELTEAQKERASTLRKLIDDLDKEESKRMQQRIAEALRLSETSEIKILKIREQYSKAFKTLEENKTSYTEEEYKKRVDALKKAQAEEIGSIALPELQKGQDWTNVFEKNALLAREKIKQGSETLKVELKKMLEDGRISVEQYNEAIKQIKDVEIQVSVSERGFGRLKAVIKELRAAEKGSIKHDEARQKLAGEINYWGQGAVTAGNDLLGIADQLGIGSEKFREDMAGALDLANNAVNLAASIASGDVVGMITNGIKTLASALNLFSKDKKFERAIKDYQAQLDSLGRSFTKLQDLISNSVGESFYTDSRASIDNLREQQRVLNEMASSEGQKKKSDDSKIQEYRDQLDSLDREVEAIERSITEKLIQTTFKSLADELTNALVSAFEAGESAIESMDKVFDQFIKNALVNSLKLKMIEPIIKEMTDDLSNHMKANDNSLIGFDFQEWKDKLGQAGAEFTHALDEAYRNLDLSKASDNSTNTLSGAYSRASQESIDLLAGQTGAMRVHLSELVSIGKANQTTLGRQLQIASDNLAQIVMIERNTRVTAEKTTEYLPYLRGIEANTKSNLDVQLRAAGKYGY